MAAAPSTGIERLASLDTIYIKRSPTFVENGFKNVYVTNYSVHSQGDAVLFHLIQKIFDFSKVPVRRRVPIVLAFIDETGKKVFWMERPDCMSDEFFGLFSRDKLLNVVRYKPNVFKDDRIHINDVEGELMLRVTEDRHSSSFLLRTKFKQTIGSIDKITYKSDVQLLPYLDGFVVRFPAALDPQLKLAVIVACRLIDLVFYFVV